MRLVRVTHDYRWGIFTHHPDGKAIVLEITYPGTPVQIVNVYMLLKGPPKKIDHCCNGYAHISLRTPVWCSWGVFAKGGAQEHCTELGTAVQSITKAGTNAGDRS